VTEDERENFEERAAIVEYEADWPRPIAESEALRSMTQARWKRKGSRGWMCPRIPDGQ
jgi:hypothetical protein